MLKGSILQQLEQAHRQGKRPLNFGVYYKNTLVALCHALEDFILECGGEPLMVTAFQRGKWYLQEAERYADLAQKSSQVVILAAPETGFAEHPTSQRENVALVGLNPDDPVAQEWHLIILAPTYTAMVLCQELSVEDYGVQGQPQEDKERKFYGFWTFEPELVQETVELAIAHIGEYNPQLQQRLTQQLESLKSVEGTRQRDDLGAIASRIVHYLQAGHPELHHQALDDNLLSNEMQAFLRMAQLIDQADAINPNAAAEVATLLEVMGQLLDLPAWQVKRLRLTGLLHRLAAFQGVENLVSIEKSPLQEQLLQQDTHKPRSVLRIMPQLSAIARIITHQTEKWDGTGQPDGLAYDEIPLESRMLALVAEFQQRVAAYKSENPHSPSLAQALSDCQALAGSVFDPKLVETLELLVKGLQQGWNLQTAQPKIAAGMWLLDTHASDDTPLTPNRQS
ncbi:DICT sensory domain-containing protein [Oscillatoria laete-virens NRMC-F 0139]|nr:DICT sensory domain-containing protein [Oscillatoria laete-virens]MDL5053189.1 DICT sensory domain-containing protein [Oscillatoria laete-virens NRMC-F 0139]